MVDIKEAADNTQKLAENTVKATDANNEHAKSITLLSQAIERENELQQRHIHTQGLVGEMFRAVAGGAESLSKFLKENAEHLFNTTAVMSKFKEIGTDVANLVETISNNFATNSKEAQFAAGALAAVSTQAFVAKNLLDGLSEGTNVSSKSAAGFGHDLTQLSSVLSSMGMLGKIPAGLIEKFGKFYKATESVQQFENSLLSLNSKFSGFGDNKNKMDFIGRLDENLHTFTDTNRDLANSLGLSIDEVTAYSAKLMALPGLYKQLIENAGGSGETMTVLEAAVRTARGTTGDFADAISGLNLQFRYLGDRDGKVALDNLANTYAVSQKLGISFADVRSPIEAITKEFAAMGQNTEAATNLVSGLGKALLDIKGVGVETMTTIVKEVSANIDHMSIAQKAFLSAQTGGPGGLRGAYEIDLLARQGKMDEIYQKMETALKNQMGGRIVNLEEASRDQGAAAQMTKQLAFMKDGPFGAVVKSDAEAYRLLEAFSAGTKPIADASGKAIHEAFSADSAIQTRQHHAMQNIANNTAVMMQDLNIIAAREFRGMLGGGNEEVAKRLESGRTAYSHEAQANVLGKGPGYLSPTAALGKDMGIVGESFGQIFGGPKAPTLDMPKGPTVEETARMTLRDPKTGTRSEGNVMDLNIHVTGVLTDNAGREIGTVQGSGSHVNAARTGIAQ